MPFLWEARLGLGGVLQLRRPQRRRLLGARHYLALGCLELYRIHHVVRFCTVFHGTLFFRVVFSLVLLLFSLPALLSEAGILSARTSMAQNGTPLA